MQELIAIALLLPGLVFLFAVVLLGLVQHREDRRIVRKGVCTGCGYSLRGNLSGVCPECGLKISKSVG